MDIAWIANPILGGWSPLEPQGWSGGEEIIESLTAELALRSHRVTVFYDGPPLNHREVQYLPRERAVAMQGQFDVAVFFKCPELGGLRLAPRAYLWTDQERPFDPEPFEVIGVTSAYLAGVISAMTPRAAARLKIMRSGVVRPKLRGTNNPTLVMHCSSPDRGLTHLLDCWADVQAENSAATLALAYGWDLYDKYGGPRALKLEIMAKLERLGLEMKRLDADALEALYAEAGIWAYYCTGGEQYGLSALKAQLNRCVPVVKPWGALHENLRAGCLLAYDKPSFTKALLEALNPDRQEELREQIGDPSTWIPRVEDASAEWEQVFGITKGADFESHIRMVPPPPPFASAPGWNALEAAKGIVAPWMQQMQPKCPYIDPTLGYPPGASPTPGGADSCLLGFQLEDSEEAPAEYLRKHEIAEGTPIMVFLSSGNWRAGSRRRAFDPKSIEEVFGAQPEQAVHVLGLDPDHNAVWIVTFRYSASRVGARDLERVRKFAAPRQTVTACMMARDAGSTIPLTLRSIERVVDELVVIDTGSKDETMDRVQDWSRRTGIPTVLASGTSPRWCYTCSAEHAVGEMAYGHLFAGFETARNQSIAEAHGDWILWLDADEEFLEQRAGALDKYLRPSLFKGFCVSQHHHSVDPPNAGKIDNPVRLFRREPDPEGKKGLFPDGPLGWPTYFTGLKQRFTGIVHEHPGQPPEWINGIGPAITLSDVYLAHRGYFLEDARRRRFVRNWPLMNADRRRYPGRRLGRFLWLRDINHQMRFLIESAGNRMTAEAAALAEEQIDLWNTHFNAEQDAYVSEALGYVSGALQVLGRGIDCRVLIEGRKQEVSGDEAAHIEFQGRFDTVKLLEQAISTRLKELTRWEPPYV